MSNNKSKKIVDIRQFLNKNTPSIQENIKSADTTEPTLVINSPINHKMNDDKFMKFFHVDKLIGANQLVNHQIDDDLIDPEINLIPSLSNMKKIEQCLMYRFKDENSGFFKHLNMTEHGRLLIKQLNLCLQMLENSINLSSDEFKIELNELIYKQDQGLLN